VPCLVNGLTIEIAGEDDLDALDLAGPAQETDRLRTDRRVAAAMVVKKSAATGEQAE